VRAAPDPIRVVIVDDHKMFAEALRVLLEADGRIALVGTATSAEEGIELAVAERADVVVMDITMPGMDGLEATRRLHEARPESAVVVISGTADFADAARAAGAEGFLTKGGVHDEVAEAIVSAARDHADHLAGGDRLTD
jgi:DNA-binding NarL/FixJ family response regulator